MTANAMERSAPSPARRLGVLHAAAIGAATFFATYILCWLGAHLGWPASHRFLTLFTASDVLSGLALGQGAGLALAFGALIGAFVAIFHGVFGFLAPRSAANVGVRR